MTDLATLELVAVLATEPVNPGSPHMIASDAAALVKIARGVNRRACQRCNGNPSVRGDAEVHWNATLDRADARDETRALGIMCRYPVMGRRTSPVVGVILGGDPRGYTLKLVLASGRTNDMGREGWGVPS